MTTTFYDANGYVQQSTGPDANTSISAADGDGRTYCSADPTNVSVWLEANPSGTYPYLCPSTPPTVGYDPYLGATITTYDADGRVVQVTSPLGGLTLTSYDAANNVAETTVESSDSSEDPAVVTSYTYDADDQVTATTADPGGGALSANGPGLRPRR